MNSKSPEGPIGVFDSGVGGLSVLKAIRKELPYERVIFLADQAHVPYGPRTLHEVRAFTEEITRYLLKQGAKLIVVACNTASAAALHYLRQTFPDMPFVGMEPAVKPAAEGTQSGVVGVLATPATFQGALYASVVERFANNVELIQHTCPGLVLQIENGLLASPQTRAILVEALQPMLAQGVDTIVLGCTHYPFVIPIIQEIVGPNVRVIDPSPAVARQVGRVLNKQRLCQPDDAIDALSPTSGTTRFLTTGDPTRLQTILPLLLATDGVVESVLWRGNRLTQ